jgi:diaminopimelate epimerase
MGEKNKIKFTKMHGNGNDFVLFDEFKGELIEESLKPNLVQAVCHRRFGIGADGVLFVQRSDNADAKFRYFNSDGSEADMCGNGIRCFSRYIVEEGYAESGKILVETRVGILELNVSKKDGYWVRVNMGQAKTRAENIPVKTENNRFWGEKLVANYREFEVYAVNTGVPHAVIFMPLEELRNFDLIPYAREIRYNIIFPEGTNVNFVSIVSENRIEIRTYERGVEDETLSCGTGSVASAFIARELELVKEPVEVITKGGVLIIEFQGDNIYMTGTANRVFDGELNLKELRRV